ncbi:8530_t:CDS:10 [Diversispora eburnea]|uniref:8530_t:CDS:1 n=1 Tax=Diversispora eburnea TaxID=1213867 RepID=A0A9N8V1Q4_9GLOM|nr:8530_t:CDS:10 [Diversispora eburnea]
MIWKVRVGAYEELTKKFSTADPNENEFRPYEGLLKNIATDSNAVAQEAGLLTLFAYVENAPNPTRPRASIVPAVVDKGFGSARVGTKKKAVDLILKYIEVDIPDPVAKQPKLVATTVHALKEIISSYGAKTVNIKNILKILPKIFAHTDKNVRAEGSLLVIELYKWLGQNINSYLSELKPVQIKELNEAFEKLPQEKPTQQRLLRSQQAAAEAAAEAGEADKEEAEEEKELDAYELAEPVDILSKMAKDFYTQLGSSKWKERNEALVGLLEISKTPRIADNNYTELRISDSNILVVTSAAGNIEALASGLRDAFAKYKSTVIDVAEDIINAGKHKNPQVKTESMKWLVRCLKSAKVAPNKAEIKSLIEMMVKSSEDSFEPVRVAAFEGLGTIMKVIGEKTMNPFLEGLDDIRKVKIKEFFDKAEVKIKVSTAKRPPPPVSSSPAPKGKKDEPKKAAPKTAKSPAKKVPAKAAKTPGATSAIVPPAAKKGGKTKEEEPIRYKFTNEEVEDKFSEMIPEEQTAEMSDKNWKLRLAAIEKLYDTLSGMDPAEVEAELVVRFLAKKPGWKETPSFGKPTAALCIPILSEKLGDIKVKKSAGETLTAFAEKISLQFVLGQAYEPLRKAKSPKVLADNLTWINGALMEFGIAGLQIRELIDFLKFCLSSTNASVRTNSVTILGSLRIHVGPDIRTFVQDLNATQLAIIDNEFEKVKDEAPPKPVKASVEVTSSGGKNDVLDELFPKVDIGALFTSKILTDANDDKWKTRKEALEQIISIIDAHKRIKPNLGDFVPILKARLADNNKNIQMMALDICGKFANAMGKPFERHVKILIGPVIAVLTDQKATVRGSAISALECLANATGLDPLVQSLATSIATENPLLRKDLLTWYSDRLKDADEKNNLPDLQSFVLPILSCLQDRNGEVRKAAQSCLGPIVKSAGYDFVVTRCGDLKGAVKQSIMPMIEAVRPAHGNGPLPRGKDAKKLGQKSRIATTLAKDNSDDVEDEDPTPKLPPGLVLRPPAQNNNNTRTLAQPLPVSAVPNSNIASGLTQPNSISMNGSQQSSLIPPNRLPSAIAQRGIQPPNGIGNGIGSGIGGINGSGIGGGMTSGIGRGGLTAPTSRLQFSKFRQGSNGMMMNNQVPNEIVDEKNEPSPMDIDKFEYTENQNSTFLLEIVISKIQNTDYQQSIEGLKDLDKHLGSSPESLAPFVNDIISALAIQVRYSFSQLNLPSHVLLRLCKHLINALVMLFSNKDLALKVSQESLNNLLTELAHRLLDHNLQILEGGQQLSKALNVSMVKVLENNLREVDSSTHTKFTELIMKCLWKLSKTIQENLKSGALVPNELLLDIHHFMNSYGPADRKNRTSENSPLGEVPFKTIKTILFELITGLGESIFEHLNLIDNPQKSNLLPCLIHMFEAYKKKQPNSTTLPATALPSTSTTSNVPSATRTSPNTPMTPGFPNTTGNGRSSGSHEVEMNARLTQIFLKIGTREDTKQGIYELYEFQKHHPEMEGKVATQLAKTEVKTLIPEESGQEEKDVDDVYKKKLARLQHVFGYDDK